MYRLGFEFSIEMEKDELGESSICDKSNFLQNKIENWQVDYELHLLPKDFPVELLLDLLNKGRLYQKITRKDNHLDRLCSNKHFTIFEKIEKQ